MSKKNDRNVSTRRMAPAGSKTGEKSTNFKASSKPSGKGSAKVYPVKSAAHAVNLPAVRIVAGILAALCLAGGIAVGVLQAAAMSTATIIELVLLALITVAAAYTAIRPDVVSGWFARLSR